MSDQHALHIVPPPPAPVLHYQHHDVPAHPPGWTNVRMFGLLPEALAGYARYRMIVTAAIRLILVLPMIAFLFWLFRDSVREMLPYIIIFASLMSLTLFFRAWRVGAQTRREWPHLRIHLSDQGLMRTLPGYPDIIILNHQIKKIRETSRAMVVSSSAGPGYILIPSVLEKFPDVRCHLAALKPITPPKFTWLIAIGQIMLYFLISAANVTAFFGGMFTSRLSWELIALGATLALGIWSFVRILRSPNLRPIQKIPAMFALFLPLMLVAKIVFFHIILKR